MAGFRVAGWTCFSAAAISFLITLFGVRGIGIVGQRAGTSTGSKPAGHDIELAQIEQLQEQDRPRSSPSLVQSVESVETLRRSQEVQRSEKSSVHSN